MNPNTVNIPVTQSSDSVVKNIDAGDLIYVFTDGGSGSIIEYNNTAEDKGVNIQLTVDETPAAVSALAKNLISIASNSEPYVGTLYLTEGRVKDLIDIPQYMVDTHTLTGTSGTANISVDGGSGAVLYLATWTTSLVGTATAFVTSHAVALLAAGVVVTSSNDRIIFTGRTKGTAIVTIAPANVSGNLAGTKASTIPVQTTDIIYNDGRSATKAVNVDELIAAIRTLIEGVVTTFDESIIKDFTTGITAYSGGGQTNGVVVTTTYNDVTTVAASGDSMKLPPAVAATSEVFWIKNSGANNIDLFPGTSDTIDDNSANTAISIAPQETVIFWSVSAVKWESDRSRNFINSATGITAFAGGGQGSAVLLAAGFNDVTTVATVGDSVKLPVAKTAGNQYFIIKNSGATPMDLFPNTSDKINGGSANAAISVGTGVVIHCWSINATDWETNQEPVPSTTATSITAFAGGGQGSAVLLAATFNDVVTVATSGDSVKLPIAEANQYISVKNSASLTMDLFPNTSDTIDNSSADAAIAIEPGVTVNLWCVSGVKWESDQLYNHSLNETSLTAFAGGGQGSALLLAAEFNDITTVATAADSVKLPPAATLGNQFYIVKNSGVNNMDLFPGSADAINDLSTNVAISIAPQEIVYVWSVSNVRWEATQLRNFAASETGITAFAGGGQGDAVLLVAEFNDISTVATAGDSVKLPVAKTAGNQMFTVKNSGATDLDIFPNTSDKINGGSANAAIRIIPGDVMTLYSIDGVNWETQDMTAVGSANAGTTAVEFGSGRQHRTELTVSTTLPAITGDTDQGLGKLLYTLPSGVLNVRVGYMSLAITQSQGNINSDTPDGGLGTTIGAGAVATLDTTPAFENILTGQTFDNCTGTAEVKTVSDQPLAIETGGDKEIYFNVADGWNAAAGGDTGAGLAGTVVLLWESII